MKSGLKIMDSDLHVIEPWDLYLNYMDPKWGDRVPRAKEPVGDWSYHRGMRAEFTDAAGMPVRKGPDGSRVTAKSLGVWRRGARIDHHYAEANKRRFDAPSTLDAMDVEGVDTAVLFRTRPLQSDESQEPAYAIDICRAWNDWCSDYCSSDRDRLKFAALISLHDVDLAVEECRRAVTDRGAVGVCMNPEPINGCLLHDSYFDPYWDELERLGVPACFHPTPFPNQEHVSNRFFGVPNQALLSRAFANPVELMMAAAELCSGGVLQRHPRLKVALLEGNCTWLPWLLYKLDELYEKFGQDADVPLEEKPSHYFMRQCYVSVDVDETGVDDVVNRLGDENIVFSTDYPHTDGEYPFATQTALTTLGALSESSRRKVLWENCARLYGLS